MITSTLLSRRIPRSYPLKTPGLLAQGDIEVKRGGLRAKMLVFKTPQHLRRFWRDTGPGGELGKGCLGAVNDLTETRLVIGKDGSDTRRTLRVDSKYFCLIGLTAANLTMEVITHEAGHAAFAYTRRKSRNYWDKFAKDFEEEKMCYPLGLIGREMVRFLFKAGFYTEETSLRVGA